MEGSLPCSPIGPWGNSCARVCVVCTAHGPPSPLRCKLAMEYIDGTDSRVGEGWSWIDDLPTLEEVTTPPSPRPEPQVRRKLSTAEFREHSRISSKRYRQRKKAELAGLRRKKKRLLEERAALAERYRELQGLVMSSRSAGDINLRRENALLRQEILRHRGFVCELRDFIKENRFPDLNPCAPIREVDSELKVKVLRNLKVNLGETIALGHTLAVVSATDPSFVEIKFSRALRRAFPQEVGRMQGKCFVQRLPRGCRPEDTKRYSFRIEYPVIRHHSLERVSQCAWAMNDSNVENMLSAGFDERWELTVTDLTGLLTKIRPGLPSGDKKLYYLRRALYEPRGQGRKRRVVALHEEYPLCTRLRETLPVGALFRDASARGAGRSRQVAVVSINKADSKFQASKRGGASVESCYESCIFHSALDDPSSTRVVLVISMPSTSPFLLHCRGEQIVDERNRIGQKMFSRFIAYQRRRCEAFLPTLQACAGGGRPRRR